MLRFLGLSCTICAFAYPAPSIKIQGSTTVNPIVSEATDTFRDKGWKITVDTQGGSSGGLSALGDGLVTIAMSGPSMKRITLSTRRSIFNPPQSDMTELPW